MPSPLTSLTFSLNQRLNDFLLTFQIRWKSAAHRWENQGYKLKEKQYFVIASFATAAWLVSSLSIIRVGSVNPELYQPSELFTTIIEAGLCLICLVLQFILWRHYKAIIHDLNVLDGVEKDSWFQTNIIYYTKKGTLEALSKSLADLTGAMVFTLTTFGGTVAISIVVFSILWNEWDPISLLMIYLKVGRYKY